MNVEETKRLILRRLGEIREVHVAVDAGHGQAPDRARPEPSRHSSRSSAWRGRGRPELERRVQELEDRLAAIERCFMSASVGERQRLQRELAARIGAQTTAVPGVAPTTLPGAGAPPPRAAEQAAAVAASFDFGGRPYRMIGVAGDGLMSDVLQMLASNQKNGRFSLFVGDERKRFDAFMRDGEIVHATAGEITGDAAFFALMATGQEKGFYGFLEEDVTAVPKTIEAKAQFLILDALRRIDEGRGESAPGVSP